MTALLVFFTFLLLAFFGFLPVALLVRQPSSGERILLAPVLGLCTVILVTNVLAFLGLTGTTIAIVTLAAFGALLCAFPFRRRLGYRSVQSASQSLRSRIRALILEPVTPLSTGELRESLAPLLVAVTATLFIAWPLLWFGYADYWGFANPDEALYMHVIQRLQTHAFGVPTLEEAYGLYSPNNSVIIGVCYIPSILSVLTGVPAEFFFGILCAAAVILTPLSVYYLAAFGFRLRPRLALSAAIASGCSSLLANTFYIHALGSLCLGVLLPVGVCLCLQYVDEPSDQRSVLVALVGAAMFYCYYPGFAVMAAIWVLIIVGAWIRRAISIKHVRHVTAALVILLVGTFIFQFGVISKQLLVESLSSRLRAEPGNEVLMFFGLSLTEELAPFFWGFKLPMTPFTFGGANPEIAFWGLFGVGLLLGTALLSSFVKRVSGLRVEYRLILIVIALSLGAYTLGRNGYGLFKLVGWVHTFALIGLVASMFGLFDLLRRRKRLWRIVAVAPLLVLTVYVGLNLIQSITLCLATVRKGAWGGLHNARGFELRDFRTLEGLDAAWGRQGFNLALPDPVLQRWAVPFLKSPRLLFFPIIDLRVADSDSPEAERRLRFAGDRFRDPYVLRADDIVEDNTRARCRTLWSNGPFMLVDTAQCRDMMTLGSGWYRMEESPGNPIHWQRKFRWLRKRGELLVFYPSNLPQRLHFTAVCGYGNPLPQRTVRLYLDGVQFDEIRIYGYARVASRPFTARRPWSRIEFEVQETAQPLPRLHALWNSWVPRDPRLLNLALSDIGLAPESESAPPARFLDFRSQEQFSKMMLNGVYPDRWIGNEARIELPIPAGTDSLELGGMVPAIKTFSFPYSIQLLADGRRICEEKIVRPGSFQVRCQLNQSDLPVRTIAIRPAATFVTHADPRPLSIRVDHLALRAGPHANGFDARPSVQR